MGMSEHRNHPKSVPQWKEKDQIANLLWEHLKFIYRMNPIKTAPQSRNLTLKFLRYR